ncbi:hypothetical protein [Nocardia sp. CDC160]|uniref:hypothetical protein n=1 Tax=Nocardia sp. CDC160 TaxID=3112166 RepID=UPI002DB6DE60|nr:hypothetical protein [Nocardia sp. CDC160]MEC3919339.1 hypothetical protein [Nocardia sp. CDC160]
MTSSFTRRLLTGAALAAVASAPAAPALADTLPPAINEPAAPQPTPLSPDLTTSAGWLPPINFTINLAGFDFKHTDLTPEWTTYDAGNWYVSPDLPIWTLGWLADVKLGDPAGADGEMTLYLKDGTTEVVPLHSNLTIWNYLSKHPGRDYAMVCHRAAMPGDAGQRTCFRFVN